MRRILFLLACISLVCGCSQKNREETARAKMTFFSGDVVIVRSGQELKAEIGKSLLLNDIIRTPAGAEANIFFPGKGVCKIKGGSVVQLKSVIRTESSDEIKLKLNRGKIISALAKLKKGAAFEVETPTAVAGVRGTTFMVSVEPGKQIKISVLAGRVDLKNSRQPGKVAVVAQHKEAVLPGGVFEKVQITGIKEKTVLEIKEIARTPEIQKENLTEIAEEIASSVRDFKIEQNESKNRKRELEEENKNKPVKW